MTKRSSKPFPDPNVAAFRAVTQLTEPKLAEKRPAKRKKVAESR